VEKYFVRGRRITASGTIVQFSLPTADAKRLSTWSPEIVQTLLPDAPCHSNGHETRFGRRGSLAVYPDGGWFDYEAYAGGDDAVTLIAHLIDNPAGVRSFSLDWLKAHPGVGPFALTENNEDAARRRDELHAARAHEALGKMVPLPGTESAINLVEVRGLPPVFPPLLGHLGLGHARHGEAALVAAFTNEAGTIGGVQLGYLTPGGRKSSLSPPRAQFWIEPDREQRRGYLFRIAPVPSVVDNSLSGVTLVAEGIEKLLAVHAAFPGCTVLGLGGIGRLRHIPPIAGDVLIVRDGDKPGCKAEGSLLRGIDHLILSGTASVRVTRTPDGEDADSFLKQHGVETLRALILNAEPAALSPDGEARRLATIRDPIDLALARNDVAKRLKIPKSALDAKLSAVRKALSALEEDTDDRLGPEPWPEPVTDIGTVLTLASDEIGKYVVATQAQRDTAVLWAVHTHFVHNEFVQLPIAPQLGIRAVAPSCGKSTLLDTAAHLVRRPIAAASLTAAVVYRVVDEIRPTMMLDECDVLLRKDKNPELVAILRSAHRRRDAVVWRSVPTPDGNWTVKPFSAWCTYAYTAVGKVEEALQSRAIAIVLQRATPQELKRLHPLEDGTSEVLLECGRKFTRWAQDQVELPTAIVVPDTIDFRDRDNWRPLLRIAKAAGDAWFRRACTAATTINGTTVAIGDVVPLLADIREAFTVNARDWLTTEELVNTMLSLPEPSADWTRAYRGLSINAYFLRDRLKDVIDPPERERRRGKLRGYELKHFDDAFARYLPTVADTDRDTPSSAQNFIYPYTCSAKTSNASGHETKDRPISRSYTASTSLDSDNSRPTLSGDPARPQAVGTAAEVGTTEPRT
jgi:hypothetical protein